MHKSTLMNYFITSLLKKQSVKNDLKISFCRPIIPVSVSIFFKKILCLYYQIAGLLKTCQKKSLTITDHNKFFDSSTKKEKNAQNPHYWLLVISHQ